MGWDVEYLDSVCLQLCLLCKELLPLHEIVMHTKAEGGKTAEETCVGVEWSVLLFSVTFRQSSLGCFDNLHNTPHKSLRHTSNCNHYQNRAMPPMVFVIRLDDHYCL